MITIASGKDFHRCADIRLEVFVGEQGVPENEEIDARDTDPRTVHLLAIRDGDDVGTARILPEGRGHVHIGRVAVRAAARRSGVGRELMAYAAQYCSANLRDANGQLELRLSSQLHAIAFYESCGYTCVPGEAYLDAGLWHRDMIATLS